MRRAWIAALCAAAALAAPPGAADPAPGAPVSAHVDRTGRRIYLLDADGRVVESAPVGIGRGGLARKTAMSDLITPTGTFSVDLVLTDDGGHDAVAAEAVRRFAGDPEFARLLAGEPGLPGLFANMNGIDFDGDGAPDRAYGVGYIGLTSDDAVTGPKMRRFSRDGTAYWYSIALHHTPDPANLGAANSGGCVHVSEALLRRLVDDGVLTLGSTVTIADGPPAAR